MSESRTERDGAGRLQAADVILGVADLPQDLGGVLPEERGGAAAKQDLASYVLDPAWVMKKLELLDEPHKKMVLEIVRALLRLEGKQ